MAIDKAYVDKELEDALYKFFRKNDTFYFDIGRWNPLGNQSIELGKWGGSLCVSLHFHTTGDGSDYVDKELRKVKALQRTVEQQFVEYVFGPFKRRLENF